MQLRLNKKTGAQTALFFGIAAVLLLMLTMAPQRLDDWTWGSDIGIDRLNTWFDGYNGRYAGNIAVIILTRLPALVRSIVEVTVLAGIFYNIRLILRRSSTATALFGLFFFLMPLQIFSQTVTWTSGFSNYVFSLLVQIYLLRICIQADAGKDFSKLQIAVAILVVFLGQLFLENITLYTVCLTVFLFARSVMKNTAGRTFFGMLLVASIGGALLMFSNTAYFNSATSNAGAYKSITILSGDIFSTLKQWATVYATDILPYWIVYSGPLNVALIVACVYLLYQNNLKGSRFWLFVGILLLGVLLFLHVDSGWLEASIFGKYFRTLFYTCFILFVAGVIFATQRGNFWLLVVFVSQFFMVGPLLFVYPIGARCFLAPYAVWCLLAVMLYSSIANESLLQGTFQDKKVGELTCTVLSALIFAVLCCSTAAQAFSWHVYAVRDQVIEYALTNNLNVIEIPEVPQPGLYCFGANVSNQNEYWLGNYKNYYGIPEEVELSFCPYSEFNGAFE